MIFSTSTLRPASRTILSSGDVGRKEPGAAGGPGRPASLSTYLRPAGDAGSEHGLLPSRTAPGAAGHPYLHARRRRPQLWQGAHGSLLPELGRAGRSSGDTALPFLQNEPVPTGGLTAAAPLRPRKARAVSPATASGSAQPPAPTGTTRVVLRQRIRQPRLRSTTPSVPAAADGRAGRAAARLSPLRARPHRRTPAAAAQERPPPASSAALTRGGHASPAGAGGARWAGASPDGRRLRPPPLPSLRPPRASLPARPGPRGRRLPCAPAPRPGCCPPARWAETRGLPRAPLGSRARNTFSESQPPSGSRLPGRSVSARRSRPQTRPSAPELPAGLGGARAVLSFPPFARDRQPGKNPAASAGACGLHPVATAAGDRGELISVGLQTVHIGGVRI